MSWELLPDQVRPDLVERVPSMVRRAGSAGRKAGKISFRDTNIELSEEEDAPAVESSQPSRLSRAHSCTPKKDTQKAKLAIVLVGLPGRGKTFLANKLKCYLNWLGHSTGHFNVGDYRGRYKQEMAQDASFFDPDNKAALQVRDLAFDEARKDFIKFLESDDGQVAILDATNSMEERRQSLIDQLHGRWKYMFIESVCNIESVLEQNYLYIVKNGPDYPGADVQQGLADFKARVANYEKVYKPITNTNLHFIKLNNMITGRGSMELNLVSGYIPSKIVFFLMQVCKAGLSQSLRRIWLTRHGESNANVKGWIGTNEGLSPKGQRYAERLPELLEQRVEALYDAELAHAQEMMCMTGEEKEEPEYPAVSVWTSTLDRAIQTAKYLPVSFPKLRWKALDEIDAGKCDGLTYKEIEDKYPDIAEERSKDKLRYRYPYGESYMDLVQRLEPVILEIERERGNVCIVAHQAILRVIMGYFTAAHLEEIPHQEVPQHALMELQPRHDGIMDKIVFKVNVNPDPVEGEPPAADAAAAAMQANGATSSHH